AAGVSRLIHAGFRSAMVSLSRSGRSYAMTQDLRQLLGRAVDHAVAYRESLASNAGKPKADYKEILGRFAEPLPETGTPPLEVLDQMVARSADGLMPITGPRFFAWVMGSS